MRSFQRVLHELTFDPLLARVLATLRWAEVEPLAAWLDEVDPYRERAALTRALDLVGAEDADPHAHFEHQLWCTWREAVGTAGAATPLPVRLAGERWLKETAGHPAVAVAPMTLATSDAMWTIAQLPLDRPCIVFSEDAGLAGPWPEWLEVIDGTTPDPVKRIVATLAQNGLFLTYPDFVYEGRGAHPMTLFGRRRPVSAGFLSLAGRPPTMLLPLVALHDDDEVLVHIDEPVLVAAAAAETPPPPAVIRDALAATVATLLEQLIAIAPEQWRLLATMTFDVPQMSELPSMA
jgi:hypothetical protein